MWGGMLCWDGAAANGYEKTNNILNVANGKKLAPIQQYYKEVALMAQKRRKCKLSNSDHSEVDLRQFSQEIIDTINETVPGKNPKVFENYFSTDLLSQGEAVALGRELAKIPGLKDFGKTVETFRLFDGRVYDSETDTTPSKSRKQTKRGKKNDAGGNRHEHHDNTTEVSHH